MVVAALAVSVAVLFSSCHGKRLRGKGNKITTQVPVTAFNALQLEVSLKTVVTVQPGAQPSLQLKGYENILPHIKTSVEAGQLRLYSDLEESVSLDKHDETTAELIVPSLNYLEVLGMSDIDIHGNMTGDTFRVQIAGAGDMHVDNMNVHSFMADISGAGNMEINGGAVQYMDIEIGGAGKVACFPLQADEVFVSISGAAKADVTANKKLSIDINGAGKIKYKGHPVIEKEINGAGTVHDAN